MILILFTVFSVKEVGKVTDGPTWTVAKKGDIVFVGTGASFLVVDVSRPEDAKVVKKIELDGFVTASLVDGEWLFVSEDFRGIDVFNIKNPRDPKLVLKMPTQQMVYRLDKFGKWLFVSQREYGLKIYKFEKGKMTLVAVYDLLPGEVTKALLIKDRLFLGLGDSGLAIYKFGKDGKLHGVLWRSPLEESVEDIKLLDKNIIAVALWNGYVVLFDISDRRFPKRLSQVYYPLEERGHFVSLEYEPEHNLLLTTGYNSTISYGEIVYFDVSDLRSPYAIGKTSFKIHYHYVHEAVVDGHMLFIAADFKGLLIGKWERTADGVSFTEISNIPVVLSYISAISVNDSLLAAADGFGNFAIFDVSDPSNPQLRWKGHGGIVRSEILTDTFDVLNIRSLTFVNDVLYAGLMEFNAIGVLDLAHPQERFDVVPIPLSDLEVESNFYEIEPVGDSALLIAKDFNGISILSLGDPLKPVENKSLYLDGYIEHVGVARNNTVGLGGDLFGRIYLIDLQNFVPMDTFMLSDWIYDFAVAYDSILYVANKSSGVAILTIGQTYMDLKGYIKMPEARLAVSTAVKGKLLAVGTVNEDFDRGWVQLFDITDPFEPHLLGEVNIPGRVKSVKFDNRGYVYVSGFSCGIKIFQIESELLFN